MQIKFARIALILTVLLSSGLEASTVVKAVADSLKADYVIERRELDRLDGIINENFSEDAIPDTQIQDFIKRFFGRVEIKTAEIAKKMDKSNKMLELRARVSQTNQ